jgi:hypothetical protein
MGDPGAPATSGPDKAGALKLTVGPGNSADRQTEVSGELAQRREPLTLQELPALDQIDQLAAQLLVGRGWVIRDDDERRTHLWTA